MNINKNFVVNQKYSDIVRMKEQKKIRETVLIYYN